MKKAIIFILGIGFASFVFAQKTMEYTFDKARVLLAQREVEEGINLLRKIYVSDTENANINFLMGAAYTELPGAQKEALYHLKKAVQNVNTNYVVGSFEETGSPIHVYYYLAVALVEEDRCAEGNKAFEVFKKFSSKVDKYYIDEVDRHLQKCPFSEEEKGENWNKLDKKPAHYNPTFIEAEPKRDVDSIYTLIDSASLGKRGLVTERLEYTTNAPLYGVQIGSNINPSPTSSFGNVKNVDVFIDSSGIIRYVVGHFSIRRQAETLLKSIKEKGFTDAFVVNVNNEKKYSNEVISYQNINLRSGIRGEVEYYVQLGAFNDTIPKDMLDLYFKIDGIEEFKYEEKTIISIGSYEGYKTALKEKKKVEEVGIKDAFIVAYNRGKKIPLIEAINYTEKKTEE